MKVLLFGMLLLGSKLKMIFVVVIAILETVLFEVAALWWGVLSLKYGRTWKS